MDFFKENENYKKWLLLPGILFIVFLFVSFVYPGLTPGIDLKGGTNIVIRSSSPIDAQGIQTLLEQEVDLTDLTVTGISSPAGYGVIIEFSENPEIASLEKRIDSANSVEEINALLTEIGFLGERPAEFQELVQIARDSLLDKKNEFNLKLEELISSKFNLTADTKFQSREIGASLGKTFWDSAIFVAFIGFILVALVIFVFFREIFPSIAVLASAIFDVLCALALMSLFKVPLSLATIPTLLMLVGYSIDTDIMLTSRLLKRKGGTVIERTNEAMKTGLTMTLTTIAAVTSMLIFSYFVQIQVIFQIAAVLLFGLIGDLIGTWLMNAPALLWYIEKKKGSK
ncbi:MAG: protein translocase subunit SecF [Candidatus Diapherotrites archaeon]|nr:protein translocase subunit SecF [Candidatus Diapherotrites archaeon]